MITLFSIASQFFFCIQKNLLGSKKRKVYLRRMLCRVNVAPFASFAHLGIDGHNVKLLPAIPQFNFSNGVCEARLIALGLIIIGIQCSMFQCQLCVWSFTYSRSIIDNDV